MEAITLRLPQDLLNQLEEEADTAGFSSRSEYIRHLLANREFSKKEITPGTEPNTISSESISELHEEVSGLSETVATINDRLETVEEQLEQNEPTVDSSEDTVGPPENSDSWKEHFEEWLDDNEIGNENTRIILLDAAQKLNKDGPMATGDLKQYLYERHSDRYSSAETLWGSTVERLYEDTLGFEKPQYGTYSFKTNEVKNQVD